LLSIINHYRISGSVIAPPDTKRLYTYEGVLSVVFGYFSTGESFVRHCGGNELAEELEFGDIIKREARIDKEDVKGPTIAGS
jgi:hypothetical protein